MLLDTGRRPVWLANRSVLDIEWATVWVSVRYWDTGLCPATLCTHTLPAWRKELLPRRRLRLRRLEQVTNNHAVSAKLFGFFFSLIAVFKCESLDEFVKASSTRRGAWHGGWSCIIIGMCPNRNGFIPPTRGESVRYVIVQEWWNDKAGYTLWEVELNFIDLENMKKPLKGQSNKICYMGQPFPGVSTRCCMLHDTMNVLSIRSFSHLSGACLVCSTASIWKDCLQFVCQIVN